MILTVLQVKVSLFVIASIAGLQNSVGLITLYRLEGRRTTVFGEKRPFSDVKTKKNKQADDWMDLLCVTFCHNPILLYFYPEDSFKPHQSDVFNASLAS